MRSGSSSRWAPSGTVRHPRGTWCARDPSAPDTWGASASSATRYAAGERAPSRTSAEAVDSPLRLSSDRDRACALLDLVDRFPNFTWGRDEQRTGEMWNSNSLTSWLLVRSGHDLRDVRPPERGRAPGWERARWSRDVRTVWFLVAARTEWSRLRSGRSARASGHVNERFEFLIRGHDEDGCPRLVRTLTRLCPRESSRGQPAGFRGARRCSTYEPPAAPRTGASGPQRREECVGCL